MVLVTRVRQRERYNGKNGKAAMFPCAAWRHARCLWRRTRRVSQPGSGIPSPEHIPSLHYCTTIVTIVSSCMDRAQTQIVMIELVSTDLWKTCLRSSADALL